MYCQNGLVSVCLFILIQPPLEKVNNFNWVIKFCFFQLGLAKASGPHANSKRSL